MTIIPKNIGWSFCSLILFLFLGCKETKKTEQLAASELVPLEVEDEFPTKINSWYVLGGFSTVSDGKDLQTCFNTPMEYNNNPLTSLENQWYNGVYQPKYNQLDYTEIFGLQTSDSLLQKYFFLSCTINAKNESDLFLHINTRMESEPHLNGRLLVRKDVHGEDYYPIHLNKGSNICVIKTKVITNETWIETEILDSIGVAELYVNGQSNNIFYPEISFMDHRLTMTNAHQNILSEPVKFNIIDAKGRVVSSFEAKQGIFTHQISCLKRNTSYLCTMEIFGKTVRQPIVCGDYDEVYKQFVEKRSRLGDNHPRSKEIDQLLYRLSFLLNHESRQTDWWWQFKIPPLTYQLERIFADLNQFSKAFYGDFNVKYITYQSDLDNGTQRYLLVTPDNIQGERKYPLVVALRPHVFKHHHFFTSPQFTHQWAINIMQGLANRYGFIIIMPEARMYLDEDLTPFAEAEVKMAIKDVGSRYYIDNEKIYLHGICSGGYRALKMAALNPELFAAVGVYSPTYHQLYKTDWEKQRSLKNNISQLSNTPIFVFADPYDCHTPYSEYSDFIDDCIQQEIPLTFQQKINTELLYNSMIVGEEAFEFFEGKRKLQSPKLCAQPNTQPAIAELFSEPFIYIFNHNDKSSFYKNLINSVKKDYEQYFDSSLPIFSDMEVTEEMLANKNMLILGDQFSNLKVQALVNSVLPKFPTKLNSMSIHRNGTTGRNFVLVQTSRTNPRLLRFPWIEGTQNSIIMK